MAAAKRSHGIARADAGNVNLLMMARAQGATKTTEITTMIRAILLSSLAIGLSACATSTPYGAAAREGAKGYAVQPIENNRFRVSYRDNDTETAKTRALRRAAEVTLENDAEWFQVVNAYDDEFSQDRRGGSSVSIGGSSGSRGRSSVGVGLGISLPLGGGNSGPVTHVIEILTGSGDKPANARVYDAEDVVINLTGR
jgi:hypothetical protein